MTYLSPAEPSELTNAFTQGLFKQSNEHPEGA